MMPCLQSVLRCVHLKLGVHYIIPREVAGTAGVYFSLEALVELSLTQALQPALRGCQGWEKWKAHLFGPQQNGRQFM